MCMYVWCVYKYACFVCVYVICAHVCVFISGFCLCNVYVCVFGVYMDMYVCVWCDAFVCVCVCVV